MQQNKLHFCHLGIEIGKIQRSAMYRSVHLYAGTIKTDGHRSVPVGGHSDPFRAAT